MVTPVVLATEVGSGLAVDSMTLPYVLVVYALNKEVHTSTDKGERVKFALVRMEAVKWGWVSDQRDSIRTNSSELHEVFAQKSELVAWLVPFAAEHVFRTTGHRILTNLSASYNTISMTKSLGHAWHLNCPSSYLQK